MRVRPSNTGFGIWDLPQESSIKAKFGTKLGLATKLTKSKTVPKGYKNGPKKVPNFAFMELS